MSDSTPRRADRVGQLLHRELSAMIVAGLRDPRIGLVTLTEVRVTDDLKHAHVYVSVLGDEVDRKRTLEGLGKAAGYLKREITQQLDLRFAPNLHFVYDDSLTRAQRLEDLLSAASRGDREAPPERPVQSMSVSLDRNPVPPQLPKRRPPARGKRKKNGQRNKTRRQP